MWVEKSQKSIFSKNYRLNRREGGSRKVKRDYFSKNLL